MNIWIIESNKGIMESFGWFETEEECRIQCEKLTKDIPFANAWFHPLQLSKSNN